MKIFRRRKRKFYALALLQLMVLQTFAPTAHALTSGNSQPETVSFEPVGTTDMVDLFTGDFTYNIPLFELPGPNGGYPFNLAYHAGIGMDDEASWTGLGWNLNPGAISRQMRGIPDEFDGDSLYTTMSIAPNVTVGMGAGAGFEIFGADPLIAGSFGVNVYNNSFRGVGYSIEADLGLNLAAGQGNTASVGLGLTLDPSEGIGVAPALGLNNKLGDFGLRASYHSSAGLMAVSGSINPRTDVKNSEKDAVRKPIDGISAFGSTISLAHSGYTPQVPMPMKNTSLNAKVKLGASIFGVFANTYVSGFYNEGRLVNDGERFPTRSYGYLNYQNASGEDYTTDLNREKDGPVGKYTPNLPIPSMTYDIYSLTGQGISGMFRPIRTDFGILGDAPETSRSEGGRAAGDAGYKHAGLNMGISLSKSTSGAWSSHNGLGGSLGFKSHAADDPYEPWYFKVHGEHQGESLAAFAHFGDEEAVRFRLTGQRTDVSVTDQLEGRNSVRQASPDQSPGSERKTKNQSIIAFTNDELLRGDTTMINEFRIEYINATNSLDTLERASDKYPGHHWAGYSALSPEGLRYTYALPAYNRKQVETVFSTVEGEGNRTSVKGPNGSLFYKAEGTEQFLKKTEVPAYAHSYLLTSVTGPDYVDVDGNGVSEHDLGYWVKFTYRQVTGDSLYNWRDPFYGAHLDQGLRSDPLDDRGSFVYGEKEIWYLARAETKTHIAVFSLSDRKDAAGAAAMLQDTPLTGKTLKKLDHVTLYTRAGGETSPIKKVRFEYNYSLCQDIPNYLPAGGSEPSHNNGGKLTLKKLWFEYGNSQRGSLNPYNFSYNNENDPLYKYHIGAHDRWGNYKPHRPGDPLRNQDLPYVEQDPGQKENLDRYASAWSLNEIHLPSGGKVTIDYETDDYGYVQHKQATAMVPLVSPYHSPGSLPAKYTLKEPGEPGTDQLKIRFPLKRPLPAPADEDSLQRAANKEEVLRYLDTDRWQLFFKMYVNLRSPLETGYYEFVEGYTEINPEGDMGLEKAGSQATEYTHGYFYLKEEKGFHPLSLRAWQHLRTNQPELANLGKKLKPATTDKQKVNQIKSLPGLIPQIRKAFEGFNSYCEGKDWGKQVDSERSVIRLKSPDKTKNGGGLRVKQITMTDGWDYNAEGVYGQYYDYTASENGETISSGVAAYEPFIGGEENALRYAKPFTQSIPLKADNNLYFEYPVNESYYPGPQVGYGKVTVMSLASARRAGKDVLHLNVTEGGQTVSVLPGSGKDYGTTGATVHEFYTARDYPVRTDETEKSDKDFQLNVPVPLAGSISISHLTSSQGYSIVTNDMHGKVKRISQYRQALGGEISHEPISWIQYNYFDRDAVYQREKVRELSNTFVAISDKKLRKANPEDEGQLVALGQETEFFADMREYRDGTYTGGLDLNVDLTFFFPVLSVWPNVGKNEKQLRTVVTNKVIFQPGILQSVEAYNEGSLLLTEHLEWDRQTGAPLLTVTNNNFDRPVYSLQTPAFHHYAGMGAAYRNLGFVFSMNAVRNHRERGDYFAFHTPDKNLEMLYPGDELLLFTSGGGLRQPLGMAVFIGEENGEQVFHVPGRLQGLDDRLTAKVVRSGYRNQLQVMAGSINALEKPGTSDYINYGVTVQVPEGKYLP